MGKVLVQKHHQGAIGRANVNFALRFLAGANNEFAAIFHLLVVVQIEHHGKYSIAFTAKSVALNYCVLGDGSEECVAPTGMIIELTRRPYLSLATGMKSGGNCLLGEGPVY